MEGGAGLRYVREGRGRKEGKEGRRRDGEWLREGRRLLDGCRGGREGRRHGRRRGMDGAVRRESVVRKGERRKVLWRKEWRERRMEGEEVL